MRRERPPETTTELAHLGTPGESLLGFLFVCFSSSAERFFSAGRDVACFAAGDSLKNTERTCEVA